MENLLVIILILVALSVASLSTRIFIDSEFFEKYGGWIVGIGLLLLIVMFP